MPYQITEPHPTALPNHYVHCGRGGAGNMYKVSSSSSPSSSTKSSPLTKTASHTSSTSRTAAAASKTSTGRGGAGNIHPVSDLPLFSFDEEMDFQVSRERAHDVWHVGRGGAGNWSAKGTQRKNSSESVPSNASSRSGFLGRLSGAFDRQ